MRQEQRVNVVTTPFTTPAVMEMRFRATPTIRSAAVTDHGDGIISELISTDVVIEISFITRNDDESA